MSTDDSQFQKIGDLVERNEDTGAMQVESLCMNCHENGVTTLLLLRVPYFRDIILESFECQHCNFKNNSVKSAGQIQEKGTKYTLEVENSADMQRQVIRSDVSIFKIESIGIEMPKGDGQMTNVEGVVYRIYEHLSSDQDLRKEQAPELYAALEPIIQKLKDILDGNGFPFVISLDDPTGNSWIAPNTEDRGKKYVRQEYPRTHEMNEELGISADVEAQKHEATSFGNPEDLDIVDGQVYSLPTECPGCTKECTTNVKKDVIVWGTACDACGYKSSEIKTGGEIPDKGKKIHLQVENTVDLSRDILKSDTCGLICEELTLEIAPGSLFGGRFTTVEGLLTEVRDQLKSQIYDLDDSAGTGGDSMVSSDKDKWAAFFSKLDQAINGELKFTITLVDPLANSYVQDLCAPAADPQLKTEEYERTEEEEEDLGLKDMKTEGYEADAKKKGEAEKKPTDAMDDLLEASLGK
ncbi:zinc finger protein ZPR1 [Penicillium chermesinum]|nr:zinc finger protein ZPR1 [Penicillium chermesinum]